jgi:hypothetical protein
MAFRVLFTPQALTIYSIFGATSPGGTGLQQGRFAQRPYNYNPQKLGSRARLAFGHAVASYRPHKDITLEYVIFLT